MVRLNLRSKMATEKEIAKLINVIYDNETGDVFIRIKITDPAYKQKILNFELDKIKVELSLEE